MKGLFNPFLLSGLVWFGFRFYQCMECLLWTGLRFVWVCVLVKLPWENVGSLHSRGPGHISVTGTITTRRFPSCHSEQHRRKPLGQFLWGEGGILLR